MNAMAREGALVFLMSAISSVVTGKMGDRWIQAGASPTAVRKGWMAFGHVGIGLAFMFITMTEGALFIGMLALMGVFLGISICNSWAFPVRAWPGLTWWADGSEYRILREILPEPWRPPSQDSFSIARDPFTGRFLSLQ